VPVRRRYGAYWAKIDITCLPDGASEGSYAVGMVISSSGSRDVAPNLASSHARSSESMLGQMWVVPRCCGPSAEPGSAVKLGSSPSARLILNEAPSHLYA